MSHDKPTPPEDVFPSVLTEAITSGVGDQTNPRKPGLSKRTSPLMLTPDSLSAFLQSVTQILCFITPSRTLSTCALAAGAIMAAPDRASVKARTGFIS